MAQALTTTAAMPAVYAAFAPTPDSCVRSYTLDWQSASDGTVSIATDVAIVGEILRVTFTPDGGGTAPTNLYDVTLLDAGSVDVLSGQGANLSGTVASQVCPGCPLKDGVTTSTRPVVVAGSLTLTIANAGDTKGGLVTIYVR